MAFRRNPFATLAVFCLCAFVSGFENRQSVFLIHPIQEGDNLGSRAVVVGAEQAIDDTVGNTVIRSPLHGFGVVSGCRNIAESGCAIRGSLGGTEQEGHALCASAGSIRAELAIARTGSNAVLHCPRNRLGIIAIRRNIREVAHILGLRAAGSAPQESDNLGTGAGLVRCKEAVTNAAGDAVLCRPLDRLIVISAIGYVIEEVENAVVLHEGRLDLHLARGHGEGVLAAALVGELEVIAVLVGNGNVFQHIATIGCYRDGHSCTDGSAPAVCGHITVSGVPDGNGIAGRHGAGTSGIRPVGVDGGICREYGIRRDLCSVRQVPAEEAVATASGGAGQRTQLLIGGGHAAVRGRTAVAVKGDGKLGGCRRRVFLEDGL